MKRQEVIKAAPNELDPASGAGRTFCIMTLTRGMRVLLHGSAKPSDDRTGACLLPALFSTKQGQRIALYFTGRQHAGENLHAMCWRIVPKPWPRRCRCPMPCRASTSALPEGVAGILLANCLAHGRRQFVGSRGELPGSVCRYVLETLGSAYINMMRKRAPLTFPA